MNEIVLTVASWIGSLALLTILLMLTARSLIDVGIATTILPKWLLERSKNLKREEMREILHELGLESDIEKFRAMSQCEGIPVSALSGRYRESLSQLIKESTIKRDTVVGRDVDTHMRYFVNLREQCLFHPYAEKCAKIMCEFLKEKVGKTTSSFDLIVTHRNGSLFLAYEVGRILDLPLLIVSEKTHIRTGKNRCELALEGHNLETRKELNSAVFIDDSTTDGSMILECSNVLHKQNIEMNDAYVLFYRKEGKADQVLMDANIKLHSIAQVDDLFLAEELTTGNSGKN